ncbi:MAG: amidohydrolase [Halobacteriota archaeon]|uniref:amidohydrolase n=1 Tax=Natronomonas sp. TaxID=2184060 RepID=UPI0039767B65
MTRAADRIFQNADGHTLGPTDETFDAVAVRDGRVVRIGSDYEVRFLEGVETEVIDCCGRTMVPGFIDAHAHMEIVGRRLIHADLGAASSRAEAIELLGTESDGEWLLGYGYDESTWDDRRYLTREDLDRVSTDRPVVAFREDLHTASVNSVVLERYVGDLPGSGVERDTDEPTGVVTEDAAEFLRAETSPDREETKRLVEAARDYAHRLGVTAVHDMVRHSDAPAAYRELARDGDLDLRVRLYYWADHLDAIDELGLVTNGGNEYVEVGGVKTFTDGSIGAGTAKLSTPYADREGTGEWVVDPSELAEIADRATAIDLQLAVHAIGDEAIAETLEALPADSTLRHRIEHAELLPDDLSTFGAVASMQPNFLRWAREDGLYQARLGDDRTAESNRFGDVLAAGVPLAFGSDCMPFDPLYGIEQAVTAPRESQQLSVTEALRAYTSGAAYAGHDEDRLGAIAPGMCADFVLLSESPWDVDPEAIADIEVTTTVVGGTVAYEQPA